MGTGQPPTGRHCRWCGLELVMLGSGKLWVTSVECKDSSPSFTLIGPRVLVVYCPRCKLASWWGAKGASGDDVVRAEKIAARHNARVRQRGGEEDTGSDAPEG